MAATLAQLTGWLERFDALVAENQGYPTELDSAIGDADHGSNMTRGMHAVLAKIDDPHTLDLLFKTAGMTLVSTVGGASGPLYGTFLLRFGATAGAVDALDGPALSVALRAGLAGVVQRGRAERGDKTMVDALVPALDALDASLESGASLAAAARSASEAADAGRDATRDLVARKGRASYLGERSAGHLDPGAASTALLFAALAAALADAGPE